MVEIMSFSRWNADKTLRFHLDLCLILFYNDDDFTFRETLSRHKTPLAGVRRPELTSQSPFQRHLNAEAGVPKAVDEIGDGQSWRKRVNPKRLR